MMFIGRHTTNISKAAIIMFGKHNWFGKIIPVKLGDLG